MTSRAERVSPRTMKMLAHIQRLWGRFWFVPVLPAVYALLMLLVGDVRPEHVAVGIICLVVGFWNRTTKRFFIDISPFVVFAIGYDALRYLLAWSITPERVLTCALRELELSLFGLGNGVTPQDYALAHATPALDLLFAVPYAIHAYVAFVYSAFLFFVDRERMRYFLWVFVVANYAAFAIWVLLPAAPPWYIRAHGCIADLSTPPSAAGLLRVDALLGVPYFQSFYARASQVFGAIPSMHCAFPMIGLLTAWPYINYKTRPIHILYVVLMFLASVYLDHHWVIDGILGWMLALLSVLATRAVLRRLGIPFSKRLTSPSVERECGSAA